MQEFLGNLARRNELRAVVVFAAVLALVFVGARAALPAESGADLAVQATAFLFATLAEGWGKRDYAASFRRWFDGRKFRALLTGVVGALLLTLAARYAPAITLPPSIFDWLTALVVGYIAAVGGVDTIQSLRPASS